MIKRDLRVAQAKKLTADIVANKSDLEETIIYINQNNMLAMFVRETVMYKTDLDSVGMCYSPPIAFRYIDGLNLREDEYPEDIIITAYHKGLFDSYYNDICTKPRVAYDPEIRGIDNFENLLSMKAYEGLKFYKMIGEDMKSIYYIPVFSRFPNLNKADKAGISVYNLEDMWGYLLVLIYIYKKKLNRHVDMMYRTINLNSPITY